MPTTEETLRRQAPIVAQQITQAANWAESEEDLRIETEKALDLFKREAKISELKGHHEVTIGKGRADSVYNYVVIEYKKPGRLKEANDSPGNKEVINQLKDRFKGLEKDEKRKIDKLFGVGLDGYRFIFLRYRDNAWDVANPVDVTPYSTERFLRALLALAAAGKAFQPQYLTGDFGAESDLSQKGINSFYRAIANTDSEKAKVLFDEWKILFGEVGGYDISSFDDKIQTLAKFYGIKGKPNPSELLFAVHTYYALFMKLLAAEIMNYFNPLFPSVLAKFHQAPTSAQLQRELEKLEIEGGIYSQLGISNFLEGNMFSWYLDAWETTDHTGKAIDVERVVRDMVGKLDEYDPVTLSVEPTETRDLLKELYQNLFPKKVRHDLGEYYTPDWLAEWVIQKVEYDGNPDTRVLDPACGSGTFLILAIQKIREYAYEKMIPEAELLQKIKKNVIGFDLNPLAVITARLNYLIAIRDLIKYGADIEIPVYLCDSVMTPSEYGDGLFTPSGASAGESLRLKTTVGHFYLPKEIATTREHVARYTDLLESCVRNDYSTDEFLNRVKDKALPLENKKLHTDLYEFLVELNRKDRNRIWAGIIKNAFMPLFIEPVDIVIGNPPWINWQHLPDDYRNDTKELWVKYNLFPHKGMDVILGKGKKDLSTLMTFVTMDKYLKKQGKLGFVITQSVFKTSGAGQGFRRFELSDRTNVAPIYCDDMVEIKPFEAANRTSTMILQRDIKVAYPVPYVVWKKTRKGAIEHTAELSDVLSRTRRVEFVAKPVDSKDETSSWMTGKEKALEAVQKVLGKSYYRAHAGAYSGGANAVYWVEILKELESGKVLVRNITKGAKRKVPQVETVIEKDILYPLLRGRDVKQWQAEPSAYIIMVQDPKKRRGIDEAEMKTEYPKTYAYLKQFEDMLRTRAAYKRYFKETDPFYSMFNVGDYTFAPWKVVWREQAAYMTATVVGSINGELIIPDHKLMLVECETQVEAYYVCALLNSSVTRASVLAYAVQIQMNPHILQNIRIPKFDNSIEVHTQLAELSSNAHIASAQGDVENLNSIEIGIDEVAGELWALTDEELKEIQASLKEME